MNALMIIALLATGANGTVADSVKDCSKYSDEKDRNRCLTEVIIDVDDVAGERHAALKTKVDEVVGETADLKKKVDDISEIQKSKFYVSGSGLYHYAVGQDTPNYVGLTIAGGLYLKRPWLLTEFGLGIAHNGSSAMMSLSPIIGIGPRFSESVQMYLILGGVHTAYDGELWLTGAREVVYAGRFGLRLNIYALSIDISGQTGECRDSDGNSSGCSAMNFSLGVGTF